MEQNKFRCHFSIVIENLGSTFWFIVMLFVTQIDDIGEMIRDIEMGEVTGTDALLVSGILLAVLLIVFLVNCIRWAKTWISIEEDAIVIEKRTLHRKVNTIGMKNISNINTEQNLFERLVGTYKIKLDTNSKSTADETDVKIVLTKDKAEEFKKQVMLRMNEESTVITAEEENEEYDVSYSAKEIILHCVYTASVFSILFLIAVIAGFIIGIRSMHTGELIIDSLVNVIGSVVAIFIVVTSVLRSIVKDFFIYYGFKAKRKNNKIYLSHGLLKKRRYVLAVDKINAVELISPTVSRILGRQYVKLICIGVGDEKNENSMLLLSETWDNMRKKLEVLLPEFVMEETSIQRREKKSVLTELPAALVMYIAVIAGIAVISGGNIFDIAGLWIRILIAAGGLLVIVIHVLCLFMSFKTEGIGLGEKVLTIETGIFQKVTAWIPYQRIQHMEYFSGPIRRHLGLAKGVVYILANMADSVYGIGSFKTGIFEEIHKKILKRKGK